MEGMRLTFTEWLRWLKIKSFKVNDPVPCNYSEGVYINFRVESKENKIHLN